MPPVCSQRAPSSLKELNLDGYKKMINHAAQVYPNFKVVATTLREVKTATVNDWSAICWADGENTDKLFSLHSTLLLWP